MTDLHVHGPRPVPPADDALLDELAQHAGDLVRAEIECGIVLKEFRGTRLAGSSDPRVRRCDAVQQADRSGPGLTALAEDRVVVVADIRRTRRWPSWREAADRQGFRTAVALPAPVAPGVDVAVELLGPTTEHWQQGELRAAAALARQVARVVALELEVARLQCLSEELFAAVAARDVIGQATGIVMARRGCGPEAALGVLRTAAEHRGIALRDLATMILAEPAASSEASRAAVYGERTASRDALGARARRLS